MSDQLHMDVASVENMAKQFEQIGTALKQVNGALEVCMTILKTSGFVGVVGSQAMLRYTEGTQPMIAELAGRSIEMSADLFDAAQNYISGDEKGSARFG